ncbi:MULTISPECIES: hypothetical protein [unclassified Schlesneria]|uniref:hypothetical protein n=1 Tax=unclassified Schlesneria TaxID=2762017 RepID=UPI002EDBEE6F
MTIDFHCPHCEKFLKTTEDKAGLQAKCPGCGGVITIPGATGAEFPNEATSDMSPPPVPGGTGSQLRECPVCRAEVSDSAIRCRTCGEVFPSSSVIVAGRSAGQREIRPFPPGEVIEEAWRIFMQKMGLMCGALFVMVFLSLIAGGFVFLLAVVAGFLSDTGNQVGAAVGWTCFGIGYLLLLYFNLYIQIGYMILSLKVAREEHAELSDLFTGGRYVVRVLLNSLVFALIVMVGLVLLVVPGLFAIVMLWPFSYLIIDKNYRGLESLKRAKSLTEGNLGSIFLIFCVCFLCNLAGSLACYVGMLLTIPYVCLLLALSYDRMSCQTPLAGEATEEI